jgi:hypothetical protein
MWLFRRSLIGKQAPPISGEKWFNTTSLPSSVKAKIQAGQEVVPSQDLAGHPVLVVFWDYACVNCLNVLPSLNDWWKRYQAYGFFIIGVHTPEFEFGKDTDKVESALLRFSLLFPVVSDPQYETWKRYGNTVWPREFLLDPKGIICHDHQGEGGYAFTEKKIQDLLHSLYPKAVFDDPLTIQKETEEPGAVCQPPSPKISLGYHHGRAANMGGLVKDKEALYSLPSLLPSHQWALQGVWVSQAGQLQSAEDGEVVSSLLINYEGVRVFGVMGVIGGRAGRVEVRQDDLPLKKDVAGEDVQIVDGRSYVGVGHDRLYRLVKNSRHGHHQLELIPQTPGLTFHTFTFDC